MLKWLYPSGPLRGNLAAEENQPETLVPMTLVILSQQRGSQGMADF